MNIKTRSLFIFYAFIFQVCIGAESALVKIDFMIVSDSELLNVFYASSKTDTDVQSFIGKSPCHNERVPSLERKGLAERTCLVALHSFTFSNGKIGYIGVLPAHSKIHKLPCSELDTFGYRCKSGAVVYVQLSQEPTSLSHPNF